MDLHIKVDVGAIAELEHLAQQIMAPMVRYDGDALVMAQAVITANRTVAARMLQIIEILKPETN